MTSEGRVIRGSRGSRRAAAKASFVCCAPGIHDHDSRFRRSSAAPDCGRAAFPTLHARISVWPGPHVVPGDISANNQRRCSEIVGLPEIHHVLPPRPTWPLFDSSGPYCHSRRMMRANNAATPVRDSETIRRAPRIVASAAKRARAGVPTSSGEKRGEGTMRRADRACPGNSVVSALRPHAGYHPMSRPVRPWSRAARPRRAISHSRCAFGSPCCSMFAVKLEQQLQAYSTRIGRRFPC